MNKSATGKELGEVFSNLEANRELIQLPRITLVTAVYNGEAYLEDTIRSVIFQGYPNLEYILVNDGSTDRTAEIIRDYDRYLTAAINQTNQGLYAALNAGFAQSNGEVMGWLNCSDKLHTGGLAAVGSVFATFPEIEWATGRPTGFNNLGMTTHVGDLARWSRYRFLAGANQYIQQESTYWRRSLWQLIGGRLDSSYRDVGDFDLWVRFFRHARLYSVDCLIAGYRFHSDAISYSGRGAYDQRCNEIIERELLATRRGALIRLFRRISQNVKRIPKVRGIWNRTIMQGLYQLRGSDWPPYVESESDGWVMRP